MSGDRWAESRRRVALLERGPDLFDQDRKGVPIGTPFHRDAALADPETSWVASSRVHKSRLRAEVLYLHQRHPAGLTDDELIRLLPDDVHQGAAVKRRGDLVRDGELVDTGRVRPTRRGRPAIVWRLA